VASTVEPTTSHLRTGEQFKESLRDGRAVWVAGERVEDVTAHPALGPGVDLIAEMFDDQFDPELQDVTTVVDDDGNRYSRSWQIPRTLQELQARREMIVYTTMKTAGSWGRPPDLAPLVPLGLLARKPMFENTSSAFAVNNHDFAENIDRYVDFARKGNLIGAEVLADPQRDRSAPLDGATGLLRIVSQEAGGVRVSGAKSVGSISAQGDEVIFTNFVTPNLPPEAAVWAALPIATEGLKLLCRPPVSHAWADPYDHPVARAEEADQLMVFDNVLIPNDRLFNVGVPELLSLYGPVILWVHWHILTRLWIKAEIFVGAAQLTVDALGTEKFPQVRAYMADLIQYAEALRAFVLAAESQATHAADGIMTPDVGLITAGRLYSIEHYPRIIHTLQELCGQGLVMRFSRADFDSAEIGPLLDKILPGRDVTARDKNRLMNFVWDLTSDSHAGRTELFENVNATPANFLKERLYKEYSRGIPVQRARKLAGLE
jgi:4-hydroxyphenylacetate 3-monooxygenase